MKKLFTLGLILLAGQMAIAQFSHNFKMERAEFVEMYNPIDLLDRELLGDLTGTTLPIGFDFMFDAENSVDHLRFVEDGMLEGYNEVDGEAIFTLSPLQSTDLLDRGFQSGINESTVAYSVRGQAGNRVLVIEWNNVGFQVEYDKFQTSDDFANFQLIIRENGNEIDFVYGPSNVNHPRDYFDANGPMIGNASNKLGTVQYLVRQGNNPMPTSAMANLDYFPVAGANFAFTPTVYESDEIIEDRLAESIKLNAKIYPNPFLNEFSVILQPGIAPVKMLVTSPYGKVVFEGWLSDKVDLDLTGFDPGLYIVRLTGNGDQRIFKAMKR